MYEESMKKPHQEHVKRRLKMQGIISLQKFNPPLLPYVLTFIFYTITPAMALLYPAPIGGILFLGIVYLGLFLGLYIFTREERIEINEEKILEKEKTKEN